MGQILQNWRILVSASLAIVLIVGSFLLARSVESPNSAQASTESALLQAIAMKDSDGDGLTDWEEALYGTSPKITDTFNLGMTDGEAVTKGLIVPKAIADITVSTSSPSSVNTFDPSLPPPPAEGTLTAAFAKNFFMLYISAKQANGGGNLSESEMEKIVNEALDSISSAIAPAPDFKSVKELQVSGSGSEAMKMFATDAEAVLLKNKSTATTSEINYLKSVLEHNDTSALSQIASIAKTYRDSAVGISSLQVPIELVASDLALINSLMRVSEIVTDFARVNDDTLAAMLALQQYPQAVLDLGNAFIGIGKIYEAAGISMNAGTPGASFVNLIKDIAPKP